MSESLPTPATEPNPTLEFLHFLYGDDAPGYLPIWSLKDRRTWWFRGNKLDEAARQALKLAQSADVYFGIGLHPSDRGKEERGTADDVSAIPGLWIDIDIRGPAHKATDLPSSRAEALALIGEFPLEPSAIIDSGHGLQAWWAFKELWAFDSDEERKQAKILAERFQVTLRTKATAHGWNLDATHDIARVLRLPGTWNRKLKPAPVTVIEIHADRRYDPSDFEGLLIDFPFPLPPDSVMESSNSPSNPKMQLGRAALDFVANGAPIGQQRDRAVRAARNYLSAGYTVDQTAKAIWRGLNASPQDTDRKPWTLADARKIAEDLASKPAPPPRPLAPPPVNSTKKLRDFAPLVNDRLNQRRAGRLAKAEVSRLITEWLEKEGRLLLDDQTDALNPQPYLLTDDGAAVPLSDDLLLLRAALAESGMNPTEAPFKWLVAELQTRAVNGGGRKVKLVRYATRRPEGLYISCGPTRLVFASPTSALEVVPNGTNGVLFAADAALPPWRPTTAVDPMTLDAFKPALEAPTEAQAYSPDHQRLLMVGLMVSLIADVRPRPSPSWIGPKGGGKSMTARAVVKMLMGEQADVTDTTLNERDFAAAITSLPFFVLDNLDMEPQPWLSDALASAITGTVVSRRKLFSDFALLHRPVTAAIGVTTRTATYAQRPDIVDRTLPFFVGDLNDDDRKSESELLGAIRDNRDGLLTWLALKAAEVVERLPRAPSGLPSRFQDFARIVWCLDEQHSRAALRSWEQARALSITEPDQLAAALIAYLPYPGLKGTATEIVGKLHAAGADLPFLGGGKAIARRLRELRPLLALADIRIEDGTDAGGHTTWAVTRKNAEFAENAGCDYSGELQQNNKVDHNITSNGKSAFSANSAFLALPLLPEEDSLHKNNGQHRRDAGGVEEGDI